MCISVSPRTILLILGLALNLPAAVIATRSAANIDVEVAPLGSPEFARSLEKLGLQTSSLQLQLGAAADYVVAMQNKGQETISTLTMIYEVDDGQKVVRRSCVMQSLNMAPGDVRLANPCRVDARLGNGLGVADLVQRAAEDVRFFEGKTVTAIVDSVIFADGGFAGADQLKQFDRLVARDEALLRFHNEALQRRGLSKEELISWLTQQASLQPQPSRSPETLDLAGRAWTSQAQMALTVLNSRGQSQMVSWSEESARKLSQQSRLYRR
jgi:hypothetical protein